MTDECGEADRFIRTPRNLTGQKASGSGAISVERKPSVLQKGEQQKEKEGSQGCSDGSKREGSSRNTVTGFPSGAFYQLGALSDSLA